MKLLKTIFLLTALLTISGSSAWALERKISRSEYIDQWKDEAVRQMFEYGIPASITLAQGILESGDGNSELARNANNHFGIKCHDWKGQTYHIDDDRPDECFRKYRNAEDSYHDHSKFLSRRGRYSFLFELKITDYKGWAKGLKKAGYATNPKYANLLIELIEKHQLYQFDKAKKKPGRKERDRKEQENPEQATEYATQPVADHHLQISKNNIKFVVVKKGDSLFKIAKEFNIDLRLIYKYNDLNKSDIIHPGDVIYLQPKRKKSRRKKFHVVKKGETMREISQLYGVKLKDLYKKNNMILGTEPVEGQRLSLRKRVKVER